MANKEPTKEDSEGRPDFGFEYLDHTVRNLYFARFQLCLLFMRWQDYLKCKESNCLCLNCLPVVGKLFQITGFEKFNL